MSKQIDLDDLPPRVAEVLANLAGEEELVLVKDGLVVGRLRAEAARAPETTSEGAAPDSLTPDSLIEVMEQFNAMIHDEF